MIFITISFALCKVTEDNAGKIFNLPITDSLHVAQVSYDRLGAFPREEVTIGDSGIKNYYDVNMRVHTSIFIEFSN